MSSETHSNKGPAGSLAARVDAAEQRIRALRGRISMGSALTLVGGLIALAALSGYFWFGHTQITEFAEPDKLTALGQSILDEHLPEVRVQMEDEIIKNAPDWARTLSSQAVEQMPSVRGRLVEYISEQIEKALEQTELVSAEQFRKVIRDNRDLFERDAQDLASGPELSEERYEQLVDLLDRDLGIGLKDKSEVFMGAIVSLNEKLARLAPGVDLTQRENEEREFLMLVRRLQQTKKLGGADPAVGTPATIKSGTSAVEAEPEGDAVPAVDPSEESPPGTERLKGLKPAGDTEPGDTKGKEATPDDEKQAPSEK
jgi:hypothetical protein